MPEHKITLEHEFLASPEQVFDYFADHEKFGRLWPAKIRRIKTGESEPNGIGSVREIRVGPVRLEETIVSFRRPELLEYRVTRGGPLKNHLGHIEFHRSDSGGTRIFYTIEYDGRFPLVGGLIGKQLRRDWTQGVSRVEQELAPLASS